MSDLGETLTHKDLAREVGVSETTIKSYRRKFPTFIPVAGYGKPIRFKPEALDVCRAIREAFERGSSVLETERGLKERFPEYPENRARARRSGSGGGEALESVMGAAMERFMGTAAQMMEGVAKLTQAQAATEQRLDRLEGALSKLLDVEAENKDRLGRFMEQMAGRPAAEPAGEMRGETRVKAKKIVNVRSPEGRVDSYSLEDEPAPAPEDMDESVTESASESVPEPATDFSMDLPVDAESNPDAAADDDAIPEATGQESLTDPFDGPGDDFLTLPVVIQSEKGEFLGVPGRLHVDAFVQVLERMGKETGAALTSWEQQEGGWRFCLTRGDGTRLEHTFLPTTTPRGNQVAEFTTLNVDGHVVEHEELIDYFRDVKSWL